MGERRGGPVTGRLTMCRNIKVLHNFAPPATTDEVRASALQFVRKLSGTTKPSKANEAVFNAAVEDVAQAAQRLLNGLVTEAVKKMLVLLGVPESQLEAVSFGEEKPKAQGKDESAYAENRRGDLSYRAR